MPTSREAASERLRIALELHEAGVDMQRCRYRRQHPGATEEEVERLLRDWLAMAPSGARYRDYVPRSGAQR